MKPQYCLAVVGCLLVLGCGGGPFDIVKVSGTVSYEDGSPIPSDDYRLKFVPLAGSPDGVSFPRTATAKVDQAGKFDCATTQKYGDGIIRGEHKVYLKINSTSGSGPVVPAAYLSAETTPLKIDTSEGRKLGIKIPHPN